MQTTYIVYMTEVDSFQHLPQDTTNVLFIKTGRTLIKIIEYCVVDELEYQVQVFLATKHFDQIHQILVT